MTPLKNRYEFVLLYDVENGNPNGDPDAGNLPRIDVETNYGIVTDVCLKRKIRNYIEIAKGDKDGFEIYIKEGSCLRSKQNKVEVKPEDKGSKKNAMCRHYYDIRTFGAVLAQLQKSTTKPPKDKKSDTANLIEENEVSADEKVDSVNGQVRGPVQINFSRSIEPIFPTTVTITRLVDEKEDNKTTMGNKHIVPYGLYRCEGYVSAHFAAKTGFSEEDLELFWQALANIFEHDQSAARGKMVVRKLVIFKHASELGNAPAHQLFDLVKVAPKDREEGKVARAYSDYEVTVGQAPANVEIMERV
jgi:CRISPR-associated protein Csd2